MKLILSLLLLIGTSSQLVLCVGKSQKCLSYKTALDDIHELLEEEADNHDLDLNDKGGKTYVSRARYILSVLNNKISEKPSRNSQKDAGCRVLEEEILAKSKELGIEKIGLEDSLTRLRKVFNYQDDRYRFRLELLDKSKNETQACIGDRTELENLIQSMNVTYHEQLGTIKQLKEQIKLQETKYQRLQAVINANAPAIHGSTSTIFGDDDGSVKHFEENVAVSSFSNASTESVTGDRSVTTEVNLQNSS